MTKLLTTLTVFIAIFTISLNGQEKTKKSKEDIALTKTESLAKLLQLTQEQGDAIYDIHINKFKLQEEAKELKNKSQEEIKGLLSKEQLAAYEAIYKRAGERGVKDAKNNKGDQKGKSEKMQNRAPKKKQTMAKGDAKRGQMAKRGEMAKRGKQAGKSEGQGSNIERKEINPETVAQKRTETMAAKLQLTSKQTKNLYEINLKYATQQTAIKSELKGTNAKIKNVLTEQQIEALEEGKKNRVKRVKRRVS